MGPQGPWGPFQAVPAPAKKENNFFRQTILGIFRVWVISWKSLGPPKRWEIGPLRAAWAPKLSVSQSRPNSQPHLEEKNLNGKAPLRNCCSDACSTTYEAVVE